MKSKKIIRNSKNTASILLSSKIKCTQKMADDTISLQWITASDRYEIVISTKSKCKKKIQIDI